jgi:hypothetical protein
MPDRALREAILGPFERIEQRKKEALDLEKVAVEAKQRKVKTIFELFDRDGQSGVDAWNKDKELVGEFGNFEYHGESEDKKTKLVKGFDEQGQDQWQIYNSETKEFSSIGFPKKAQATGAKEPTAGEKTQRKKNVFAIEYLAQGTFPDRTTMGTFLSTPIQTEDDILNTLFVTGANPEDPDVQAAIVQASEAIAPQDPVERENWLKSLYAKYLKGKPDDVDEMDVEAETPKVNYATMSEAQLFRAAQGGDRNAYEEAKKRGLAK